MAKRTLLNAEGLDISLTRAEFDLLTALVNGQGLSRWPHLLFASPPCLS